ncbi:MAG: thioredoxin domain-containing protein [Calothrix sp. SM1_5_4]|nr:thioredoxin domain-containing protein [Calothrix sp. SM1_5_4]
MKTRVQIALVGTLLSIFAHLYLTLHYYPLKLGFAGGQSLCNLNAKFDCDAVAASPYSAFLGIPLSIWGMATNAILFFLILLAWLEWSEAPERLRRWALTLSATSVLASVIMGAISFLLMPNYCLFCIALYALSLIVFLAYKGVPREPLLPNLIRDLPELPGSGRGILIAMAAIPVSAFLTHQFFMQNFSDGKLQTLVEESLQDWQSSPKFDFVAKPSLALGPSADQASMILAEFADFRCSHCKHASYTLDAFAKSHPDVRLEFYAFPLDGACNERIESPNGISCRLAYSVYCAEKEGKGWELHHSLFEKQEQINSLPGMNEIDIVLSKEVAALGINWETLRHCLEDPATQEAIKAQTKQGGLVNVRGTPTIFANGRQLKRGQLLPVLQGARSISMKNK